MTEYSSILEGELMAGEYMTEYSSILEGSPGKYITE